MSKCKTKVSHNLDAFEHLDRPKTKSRKSKSLNTTSDKNKHKSRESTAQSSIISFFQSKTVVNDDLNLSDGDETIFKKRENNKSILSSDSDSDSNNEVWKDKNSSGNEPSVEKKNAFTVMMDNRLKSIGQNSPGKEVVEVEEPCEVKSERKKKLSDRKEIFQDWAERKGAKKRKLEDSDRGLVIEKKLEERTKRLKKMLKVRNKPDSLNKETQKKKREGANSNKVRRQKENDLDRNTGDGKWRMKVKINLSEEDTAKLTVTKLNQEKPPKQVDVLEKVDRIKGKIENGKSKNSSCDEGTAKVAPVFNMRNQKSRPPDSTIKARIDFLHSDPPELIKKYIDKHQRVELPDYIAFPTVSHVRMMSTEDQLLLLDCPPARLNFRTPDLTVPRIGRLTKGCVTHSVKTLTEQAPPRVHTKIRHFKKLLKEIKKQIPEYPVYKVFKFLHNRKIPEPYLKLDEDIEIIQETSKNCDRFQMWTDLFKPGTSKEIFGNYSALNEVKTWLETWVDCSKRINIKNATNSSSDFETDSEDSRDKCKKLPKNALMLLGPHGCGKTMTVYAICNELGINILEVNASSKRTGKKLLMELQEATRSHQVQKSENSLHDFLEKSKDVNKATDKMCLLLIEDVDVVFEQDEGFVSALFQLLTTSKRPIILTSTNKNCLHLQKFSADLVTFNKLSTKLLSPWLQLLCLVEGLLVSRKSIDAMLENNNFDMRTTLLEIQFWAQTGGQSHNVEDGASTTVSRDISDENLSQDDNSNISCLKDEEDPPEDCNVSQRILFQKSLLLDLDMTWWRLDMPSPNADTGIKDALNILETLSITDIVYKKFTIIGVERLNLTDSLELTESEESYSSCRDTCCAWSRTLFDGYLNIIRSEKNCCNRPLDKAASIRRSKSNRSLAELVPLACHLQRDSINLDYLSTLRAMNRTEMTRKHNNGKRGNRFYNYLRGLGLNNGEVNFSVLSDIFSLDNT